MDNKVTLTREELFSLVWAEPLSGVAKRYSLTGYAFRKMCIRMSIPVPRHDYWKKVRAGEKIEPPSLTTRHKGETTVTLQVNKSAAPAKSPVSPQRGGRREKAVLVQTVRATSEDPLVASARFQLFHADKQWLDNGLIWTKGKQLRIGVAPANIDRACRFMAAFLLATRHRGYRIEVNEKDTLIHIGYQPLPILLRERTKRVQQTDRGYAWRGTQLVPSGTFYMHMTYRFKERDWKISDGAVSDEAESMLDRLESASQRIDEYYRDLERRWAERAAREKAEKERDERRRTELAGFKKLLQAASRWQQAQWIRGFLSALENNEAADGGGSTDRTGWFEWARAKADWYDPLIEAEDEWMGNVSRETLS